MIKSYAIEGYILSLGWVENKEWPGINSHRRWTDAELGALQDRLNRMGLAQVSDAIGSLLFDKVDLQHALLALVPPMGNLELDFST